jgi:hypothetical protein
MPMQPDLTDEQTLFRDTTVSFIEAELPVAGTGSCTTARSGMTGPGCGSRPSLAGSP